MIYVLHFFLLFLKPKCQIIHDSGSKKSMLADPDDVSFTEQVLIIPPCVLDYGEYQFQLEVCNLPLSAPLVGGTPRNLWWGVSRASVNPYRFQTKTCDFPYPISDLTLTKFPLFNPKWQKSIPYFRHGR